MLGIKNNGKKESFKIAIFKKWILNDSFVILSYVRASFLLNTTFTPKLR
ncbi:hypothetical protein X560_2464 [Listeria fleischmannii 1991]|uniref:Uncharacterized protein n=1 Tax=Listeria fleischmannii 1991 TaxID=1430899 RepID=A0A0J8GB63_9LIST|nr:hypothetical protein X560_2464 [Listeria fleischmannii 1991]